MAVPFYGLIGCHDDSDSDSPEDWFLETWTAPAMSRVPELKRSGGIRRHNSSTKRRSWSSMDHIEPRRSSSVPRTRLDSCSYHSYRDFQALHSQSSGQSLTIPPRNPARLSVAPSSTLAPSISSKQSRSHLQHRRRGSNVDGSTVSLLAANVISTTNNTFSAMVQHADNTDDSDSDDSCCSMSSCSSISSVHDDNVITGDPAQTHLHPYYRHRHVHYYPSYSYSSTSYPPAVTERSHRR